MFNYFSMCCVSYKVKRAQGVALIYVKYIQQNSRLIEEVSKNKALASYGRTVIWLVYEAF